MALKGTLKDFGIADIFQLIGQQGKTGVLHLTDREEEVHIGFKDGNVVRAESATRKKKELLGNLLVRAGVINDRQLEEALEEQKRTLRRLGDILVGNAALSREMLKEMAQLQMSETLYRLFSWKSGTYEFEVVEVEFDPEAITPIRSESVLMEGFRRVDEWPLIRKKITSSAMTFEKLQELPAREEKGGGDDVDAAFDDAFGEAPPKKLSEDEEDDDRKKHGGIGTNERLVFSFVEPGRDAQGIIDRSRLGEFEACKALMNLVNLGYLKGNAPAGKVSEALSFKERFADQAVAVTARFAVSVVLLAAAVFLLANVNLEALAFGAAGAREFADPAAQRFLSRTQLSRLETALGVFVLKKGEPPDKLQELVEQGMLTEDDLRYPWSEPYYYRKTGPTTYVLLPPLR